MQSLSFSSCIRRHSLAHIAKSGRLYTFGLGGSGQLGIDSTGNKDLPCCVQGPFVPDKAVAGSSAPMTVDNDGSPLVVQRIFAGGDHCFIIYRPADVSETMYIGGGGFVCVVESLLMWRYE